MNILVGNDIEDNVQLISNKQSYSFDEVPVKLIKLIAHKVSDNLAEPINLSVSSGE